MIPARPGLKAAYLMKSSDTYSPNAPISKVRKEWVGEKLVELQPGQSITAHQVIEAWDEEGKPLVIDDDGKLTPATRFGNFIGIVIRDDDNPIQLMPGDRWKVWRLDENGKPWSVPLVAWGLFGDGSIFPMETDDTGDVQKLSRSISGDHFAIRHESEDPPPASALTPPNAATPSAST